MAPAPGARFVTACPAVCDRAGTCDQDDAIFEPGRRQHKPGIVYNQHARVGQQRPEAALDLLASGGRVGARHTGASRHDGVTSGWGAEPVEQGPQLTIGALRADRGGVGGTGFCLREHAAAFAQPPTAAAAAHVEADDEPGSRSGQRVTVTLRSPRGRSGSTPRRRAIRSASSWPATANGIGVRISGSPVSTRTTGPTTAIGPCRKSATDRLSATTEQVSITLSATSCAVARLNPRPRTASRWAFSEGGVPPPGRCPGEPGSSAPPFSEGGVPPPGRCPGEPGSSAPP